MEYKFNKILKQLYEDVKDGIVYLCEAFDEDGDIVCVKMSEQHLKEIGELNTDGN